MTPIVGCGWVLDNFYGKARGSRNFDLARHTGHINLDHSFATYRSAPLKHSGPDGLWLFVVFLSGCTACLPLSFFKKLLPFHLDEISLLKGHRDFVTIVSTRDDQGRPVVLAVLEGREKETVVAFLQSIPDHLRPTVEQVCTDLYDGYVNAAKEVLPHAKIVGDRFHVAKLYRAAVDELRKIEMRELKRILHPEEYAGLKGVLWALRRNSNNLTKEAKRLLELLFQCSPLLRKAYALREKLTRIFDTTHTKESAERAIRKWMAAVRHSGLDCFNKFLQTLEERMEEITNYFISRSSSGWVEGLNNKIKVLKRRCYGISDPVNLFRRLWLDIFGYEAFAH